MIIISSLDCIFLVTIPSVVVNVCVKAGKRDRERDTLPFRLFLQNVPLKVHDVVFVKKF